MELRQLVSFYHVARLRSVSKAARTLALGQPTVTTHLRKLEHELETDSAHIRRVYPAGIGYTCGPCCGRPKDPDGL